MSKKIFTTKEVVLAGMFAAFTAIMAQISIPISISPVPITMQIFAVCMAAAILGSKGGVTSQLIYVLLGIAGVPVFSNFGSGLSTILGPKGGYIISFPVAALVIGLLVEKKVNISVFSMIAAMIAGLAVCYTIGTAWLGFTLKLTPIKAILVGAGWYLPLDTLKIIIAAFISLKVRKSLINSGFIAPRMNNVKSL